jgi:MFS family permease
MPHLGSCGSYCEGVPEQPFDLKRIAVPAYGPSLLYGIAEGAILPVIALSARELGASVAVAALTVTLLGIGMLVTNIPASLVTARFGEKWAIVGAALWCMLGLVLALMAPNLAVFAAAIFMVGMAGAVFYLARQTYLTDAVPLRLRARALSTLGGVMRIGVFIGPFLGAAAMAFAGLAGAYWVGIAALLAAAAIGCALPELGEPELKAARAAAAGSGVVVPTVRSVARSHARIYLTVGLGVLLVGAVRSSRQVVIPLWAESLGLAPTAAAVIYGLAGAVDMLVFYPAGKVMDVKGRAWVAVPSMLVMGIGLLLMPLSGGFAALLLASMLVGFGNGIGSGMVMTLGSDFAPSPGRAQFLGIWRLLTDSGTMAGPALLSGVTVLAGLAAGIASTGGLALLAAAVLWYWLPKTTGPAGGGIRSGGIRSGGGGTGSRTGTQPSR